LPLHRHDPLTSASCRFCFLAVVLEFATSALDDTLPPFPPLPETFTSNEPGLWTALREAAARPRS